MEISLDSVIPKDKLQKVQLESGKEYMTETLPNEMTEDRTGKRISAVYVRKKRQTDLGNG